MSEHERLDLADRKIIESLLDQGLSATEISKTLNRSQSTISREINKNGGLRLYRAKEAQEKCENIKTSLVKNINNIKQSKMKDILYKVNKIENMLKILLKQAGISESQVEESD